MIRTTLDRRLRRLEASLTPPVQQGITLIIVSAATGETIDLASPNPFAPPTCSQGAGHSARLGDASSRHSVAADSLDVANRR